MRYRIVSDGHQSALKAVKIVTFKIDSGTDLDDLRKNLKGLIKGGGWGPFGIIFSTQDEDGIVNTYFWPMVGCEEYADCPYVLKAIAKSLEDIREVPNRQKAAQLRALK